MREHYRRAHGSILQADGEAIPPGAVNPNSSNAANELRSSVTTSGASSPPRLDQYDSHKSALREALQEQIKKLERERAEVEKKLAAFRAVMGNL